jgi:predicted dehydrogenase
MPPVTVLIIGAGSRGSSFARYIQAHLDDARMVGVAEPRPFYRQRMVEQNFVASENVVVDWRALAAGRWT